MPGTVHLMLAASRQQPAEKLCAGKHGLHVCSFSNLLLPPQLPSRQRLLRHEAFPPAHRDIRSAVIQYSGQNTRGNKVYRRPLTLRLSPKVDFTRWADEGKLLRYKPKGFSSIHPSLRDNDGAWMAYTIYSFYTSYNSSSLDGLAAPASMESLTDPQ
ncbi:uncharacterized protein PITG_15902 [Phytophthora infestans T30-4]|uniref:Uncharacterized protein n=1 Tax=Phytophthora infestans (strain T30-4) TaxID=403677 RepID=D0NS07_PHYIT|nr:uncharacterized protein PITG_15902 [Phytophthora infestans T30-4]EEY63548.1 conserved hypothetical protein [Phytophthora infestans T30-4]|eukprot:XP_002898135.1 conserved hypothetical protein [Phytophthora infestans T30-4]